MTDPRSETPDTPEASDVEAPETSILAAPDATPVDAAASVDAEAPVADEAPEQVAASPEEIEDEAEIEDELVAAATAGAAPAPIVAETAAPRARTRRPKPQRTPPPVPDPRITGPYAIVETGGKQYRVSVGDTLSVERLPAEAGSEITLDRVLLLGGDGSTRVGTPTIAGAAVTARVEDQYRGEKIVVFKYKAKKRYRRRMGHRQSLTRLAITGITG